MPLCCVPFLLNPDLRFEAIGYQLSAFERESFLKLQLIVITVFDRSPDAPQVTCPLNIPQMQSFLYR